MAECTLDVSDELVERLKPFQDRLPELFTLTVGTIPFQADAAPVSGSYTAKTPLAYAEVLGCVCKPPPIRP